MLRVSSHSVKLYWDFRHSWKRHVLHLKNTLEHRNYWSDNQCLFCSREEEDGAGTMTESANQYQVYGEQTLQNDLTVLLLYLWSRWLIHLVQQLNMYSEHIIFQWQVPIFKSLEYNLFCPLLILLFYLNNYKPFCRVIVQSKRLANVIKRKKHTFDWLLISS